MGLSLEDNECMEILRTPEYFYLRKVGRQNAWALLTKPSPVLADMHCWLTHREKIVAEFGLRCEAVAWDGILV